MNVEEYILEDGSCPYKAWFDSLDAPAAAKVATAKYRLELGNTSSIKWIGRIGEYRIDWGPGLRIYLIQEGKDLIILFGGGTKKRQQADINQASRLFDEYKLRKREKKKQEAKETNKGRKKKR